MIQGVFKSWLNWFPSGLKDLNNCSPSIESGGVEVGVQIPRPTYQNGFLYCTRCGPKEGWYLRRGSSWHNGGVYAVYVDGVPRCPVHGGVLRSSPRKKRVRESFLGEEDYSELMVPVLEDEGE